MDAGTLTILVTSICSLLMNIYQTFKMTHFQSNCGKCCSLEADYKDTNSSTSATKLL